MNSFFAQLGQDVLSQWQQQNFSLEAFPGIAQDVLTKSPPADHIEVDTLIHDVLTNDDQPFQTQSGFGQPELVAFDHPRFYIQVLFWMDGTTDIHQHEFSGAFHVMSGSSIHAEFAFENARSITPHLRVGDLKMTQIELLETGRTVPITSGSACIHSLFHLDTPSVTVVVRTQNDPGTGPQFNYLPPHIAMDPMQVDTLTLRRKQLLDVLEATESSSYTEHVLTMLQQLDFERGFFVLQHSMSCLEQLGEWERAVQCFSDKHGELATGVPETLCEGQRRSAIAAMRGHIEDPELRFFLALLMNAPTASSLLALVEKRFPDSSPVETVLLWLQDLAEPTDDGLAILDALFPDVLDVPMDDQLPLMCQVIALVLKADSAEPTDPSTHSAIRQAIADSTLSILLR